MSLQLVSGVLANTGLGAVYQSIASKYSLLSKIPLKIQMRAFAYGAVVQGIFMYRCPPQKGEGFSKRKAVEVLSPYLLISTSIAICHRQAFKANIMSTAVLGTTQLAVSQISPKIVAAMVQKILIQKTLLLERLTGRSILETLEMFLQFPKRWLRFLKLDAPLILGNK